MAIVDVRILVEGASDVEVVSKALQSLALGSEYNITISAIIPTTNLEIAKSAVAGADLLIIATDADRVGRELAERFFSELEGLVGRIERMKIPLGHDLEHVDVELVKKELRNALIRAGLKSLQVLPEYMGLRNELLDLKGRCDAILSEKKDLEAQLDDLNARYQELYNEYQRVKAENENLNELLKKRAEKVYRISEVWEKAFGGEAPDEEYLAKAVEGLGLNGKVIVGQGYIYAENEELVSQLLKTVYLALGLLEDFKEEEPKEEPEVQPEEEFRLEE
ncbi:toprim domain-containing protein [Palaeococcus ferrophilus]|uniref:toprim domain-containing protein n=1 Tax=Palaeococcus ferrophilus TaxID=83868 RepID=UPI00064FFF14|nr:toprim domain-containing protein [Palaeococcus ferrophilus]